ncbi:MAG: hypothetical protein HON94_09535 [Methylococcales bacterium]|jgi:hypothetical protein|nr:hypothetical protein [Methylococcales bacterium]MBT7409460.1 hypothetical protein [Methylococcales bacterium]
MDDQKKLEKLTVFCIETAQKMLDEYQSIIPFGAHAYSDKNDIIMKCHQEKYSKDEWQNLIDHTADELRILVKNENIFATVIVTLLESESEKGVGLQIETAQSAALFVYPCKKEEDKWVIDEPEQLEMLIAANVF